MNKSVQFFIEYNNEILIGKNIIAEDLSLLFSQEEPVDSFSIYPYHWSFEIVTRKKTENKYQFQYAMGTLLLSDWTDEELNIPESQPGSIYVVFKDPVYADGIYYNEYVPFIQKKYYDQKKQIFAVGDIYTRCKCIEFAKKQFASFDKDGNLSAIYVQID